MELKKKMLGKEKSQNKIASNNNSLVDLDKNELVNVVGGRWVLVATSSGTYVKWVD